MQRAFLVLVPALLAISATAHAADAPVWKVSEVSGDVKVLDAGHGRAAVKGALLASGSVVAAGANARAVLVHDKDFVIVSPNSRVRIAPPEEQKGFFQIVSEWGTSLFRIEHKATPQFGVKTPYLAAVVKGTVFSVTVSGTGASVQVTQGAVDVGTLDGGAHELVRPGMIASVGAADRFQLRIDGDGSRTIRSPGAPAASVFTTSTQTASAAPVAPASDSDGGGARAKAPDLGTYVPAPVSAPPVALADVTKGLVQGNTAVVLATVNVSKPETHHDAASGGGASGGSGSGNGNSGNGNGNSSGGTGAGNGNSGGSGGNPDNSGSGTDPSKGGSGNGNSGSGNGNSGGSGGNPDNSGSGSDPSKGGSGNGGSGNGNSGGSGNGGSNGGSDNGNSGGNGNGNNGNGNGNGGGNGNGNSGGNGNGNGNGNGGSGGGNGGSGGGDGGSGKTPPPPHTKPTPPPPPGDKGK